MIVLVSLIILLRELLVSTLFHMVHPYIAIHSVEIFVTLSPPVQEGYDTCPVCLFVCLSVRLLPLNHRHRSFLQST